MIEHPSTLIQIHYHYRQGGVRKVIDKYSELFFSTQLKKTYLICSNQNALCSQSHMEIINIPKIDYTEFNSLEEFLSVRNEIINSFREIFESPLFVRPIAVIFHNVSLGKNTAATSAFSYCIHQFGGNEIRFFAVLHDFAEEGREAMMNRIEKIQKWGFPFYHEMYMHGVPIQFIVPGQLSFDILSSLNFSVKLLTNPVNVEHVNVVKSEIVEKLNVCAENDGTSLDKTLPFFYYSSRIISRKNVFEAIILSRMYNVNLILGAKGQSSSDQKLYERIMSIIKKYKLNILVDPGRCDILSGCEMSPVSTLFTICDYALSTSVIEGFGYALYEPWLFKKPLIARKPSGFRYCCELNDDSFYTFFPVFGEWIDKEQLAFKYLKRFGDNVHVKKKVKIIKETDILDFADLDDQTQEFLLICIIEKEEFFQQWINLLSKQFSSGWPGLHNIRINAMRNSEEHSEQMRSYFSIDKYRKQFFDILSQIPVCNKHESGYVKIKEEFFKRAISIHA